MTRSIVTISWLIAVMAKSQRESVLFDSFYVADARLQPHLMHLEYCVVIENYLILVRRVYGSYDVITSNLFAIIISKEYFIMPIKSFNNRCSAKFKSSIVSLHKTVYSANPLSKEYNVSVSTVTKRINQANHDETKVFSDNERRCCWQKTMVRGRSVVLETVQSSLKAQHCITPILYILKY